MENTNSPSTKNTDLKGAFAQLENFLEEYLVKKAPFTLPANIKEIIVNFSPWIALIFLILALPALLVVFGLGTILMPLSYLGGVGAGTSFSLGMIFSAVTIVLEAIAIPGLFKRSKKAWYLMYYVALIGAVHSIITFNLGGLVIGTLISLYVLFQIKGYYK